MVDVFKPATKDVLWQRMRGDLVGYAPEIVGNGLLMCCVCGRFLPQDEFDLEHIIPQQAIKCDPQDVKDNPETPANVRAGLLLLCKKPIFYKKSPLHSLGCNSWKGKHFDPQIKDLMSGDVFQSPPKIRTNTSHLIAGLVVAYLAMVAKYGYSIVLMRSGALIREQFFNPRKFLRTMGTRHQVILGGQRHDDPTDSVWGNPFSFRFEDGACYVTVRNFVIILPCSHDPEVRPVRHLKYVPEKYKFRPQFRTLFE